MQGRYVCRTAATFVKRGVEETLPLMLTSHTMSLAEKL